MRKLLLILLCAIGFSSRASEPTLKDLDELKNILKVAQVEHLNDGQIVAKVEECSNNGNKYCSLTAGISYYKKNKNDKAFSYLIKADYKFKREDGKDYYPASFYLGTMYFGGLGVAANNEKAIEHFKQCVSTGHAECAYMISSAYDLSLRNNPVPAYAWMKVARKMGMNKVPGRKYVTVPETIEMMQDALTIQERKDGDSLADKVCAATPSCILTN